MKKILFSFTLGLMLVSAGCSSSTGKQAENADETVEIESVPVRVLEIVPRTFVEYGEYYGKVSPIEEATLIAFSGGTVEKISVKEGRYVKVGTSLASVDAAKATTLYETAKLNEEIAKSTWEQTQKHLLDGNASQLALNQTNLAYLGARSNRIDAEKNRRGALCIAPFSGTVISRYIELHQEIPPGTPTFTIAQTRRMKVTVGIAEGEIAGVEEGNKAEITFASLPNQVYDGKIVRLARGGSHDTYTFSAQILIDNRKGEIKPGYTAHVKLALRTTADRVVIPTGAILAEGSTNYVMIVNNSSAKRVTVTLGPSDEQNTVVMNEIGAGDQLIVEGNHLVSTGTPVRIISTD